MLRRIESILLKFITHLNDLTLIKFSVKYSKRQKKKKYQNKRNANSFIYKKKNEINEKLFPIYTFY